MPKTLGQLKFRSLPALLSLMVVGFGAPACSSPKSRTAASSTDRPQWLQTDDEPEKLPQLEPVDQQLSIEVDVYGEPVSKSSDKVVEAAPPLEHSEEQVVALAGRLRRSLVRCTGDESIASGKVLRVFLDLSSDGELIGASSEPAAGAGGLSKVASCLLPKLEQEQFPKRQRPGRSVFTIHYFFNKDSQ